LHRTEDVLATLSMIRQYKLDVRTVTMGIDLQPCASPDLTTLCDRIRERLCSYAGRLRAVCLEVEGRYGIPIVNRRIAVSPIGWVAAGQKQEGLLAIARTLDEVAAEVGVDLVGGFSALVQKGATESERRLILSLPEVLSSTERVCASVNVGTTAAGINMDAILTLGQVLRETAERTRSHDGFGCAKLVIFANAPSDNPFMAGAFHGPGEPDCVINIGVSGPGVVKAAVEDLIALSSGRPTLGDQEYCVPRHPGGRTDRPGGRREARGELRYRRPLARPNASGRGQRRRDPPGDGCRSARRPRVHRGAGVTQRRREEGGLVRLFQRRRIAGGDGGDVDDALAADAVDEGVAILGQVHLADVALPCGDDTLGDWTDAFDRALEHGSAQVDERNVQIWQALKQFESVIAGTTADIEHVASAGRDAGGRVSNQRHGQGRIDRGGLTGIEIREPFDVGIKPAADLFNGALRFTHSAPRTPCGHSCFVENTAAS